MTAKNRLKETGLEMSEADKPVANSYQLAMVKRLRAVDSQLVCQAVEDLIEIGRWLGAQQVLRNQKDASEAEEQKAKDFLEATKSSRDPKDMSN